jgi:hypothetical protein
MDRERKINELIRKINMSESEYERELLKMDLDHELKMLELEKGWLGRFFEKIFGR